MARSENTTKTIYTAVVEEVCANVREAFLDEGLDDRFLADFEKLWKQKLGAARSLQASDETSRQLISSRPRRRTPREPMVKSVQSSSFAACQLDGQVGWDGEFDESSMDDDDEENESDASTLVVEAEDPESLDSDDDDDDTNGPSSDLADEDAFDTEAVVVCQYERISRVSKRRWRLQLKAGVASINGKDALFGKATGEAQW